MSDFWMQIRSFINPSLTTPACVCVTKKNRCVSIKMALINHNDFRTINVSSSWSDDWKSQKTDVEGDSSDMVDRCLEGTKVNR